MMDEDQIERKQELVNELLEIVKQLGWSLAIPKAVEEDDEVPGMIIGEADYVDYVTQAVDEYELFFEDSEKGTLV